MGLQRGYGVFMVGSWRGASWWASWWHLGGLRGGIYGGFTLSSLRLHSGFLREASWWGHGGFVVASGGASWWLLGVFVGNLWWDCGGILGDSMVTSWWHHAGILGGFTVGLWVLPDGISVALWGLHVGCTVASCLPSPSSPPPYPAVSLLLSMGHRDQFLFRSPFLSLSPPCVPRDG